MSDLWAQVAAHVRADLLAGRWGASATLRVGGPEYHLSGELDTYQLAALAAIRPSDRVLDVCCFLGLPALRLAERYGCAVMGVDLASDAIAMAQELAALAGLSERATYRVADARNMPFVDGAFTVVWCQGSLEHDAAWLAEFDRVLAPGGRLALTSAIRRHAPDAHSPAWSLAELADCIAALGYDLRCTEDITERDIRLGWQALDVRLLADEPDFLATLGATWVAQAHEKFVREVALMRAGQWGNGRIVAAKLGR